jgi:Sulfotransferase domain
MKNLHEPRQTSGYRARKLAVRFLPAGLKRGLLNAIELSYVARAYAKSAAGRAGRLPDFLIVGAQRSGTTNLYDLLVRHPSIGAASHKEVHFFDYHYGRGERWYRGNFPDPEGDSPDGLVCGEATPTYIGYESAPARIRELVPDAKLIVLLREPVVRAVSHYHHFCRLGNEERSFEEAIAWEYDYLSAGNRPLLLDSPERGSDPIYLSLSAYAPQLERWLSTFPRQQLFVAFAEELFEDRDELLARLGEFLELRSPFPPETVPPKQFPYPEVAEGTRRTLTDLFTPYNRELEALLERPLPWPGSAG